MVQSGGGKRPVIVYDLGGVLIDWNPRHLYRKLFDDEAAMERFLAEVCHATWNEEQDRGRSFAAAIEEAAARHPDQRPMIEAYFARWGEMVAGEIDGAVALLAELKDAGYELHALTNWSAETFPFARGRFAFLDWFQSILVSADVGLIKPDPAIFRLLLERIGRAAAGVHLHRRQSKKLRGGGRPRLRCDRVRGGRSTPRGAKPAGSADRSARAPLRCVGFCAGSP